VQIPWVALEACDGGVVSVTLQIAENISSSSRKVPELG